jgi:hypothetical protein
VIILIIVFRMRKASIIALAFMVLIKQLLFWD